jgi:hypothetical protein
MTAQSGVCSGAGAFKLSKTGFTYQASLANIAVNDQLFLTKLGRYGETSVLYRLAIADATKKQTSAEP